MRICNRREEKVIKCVNIIFSQEETTVVASTERQGEHLFCNKLQRICRLWDWLLEMRLQVSLFPFCSPCSHRLLKTQQERDHRARRAKTESESVSEWKSKEKWSRLLEAFYGRSSVPHCHCHCCCFYDGTMYTATNCYLCGAIWEKKETSPSWARFRSHRKSKDFLSFVGWHERVCGFGQS